MDDFNINSLNESKNEWVARLINILTPLIIEGFKSIFDESVQICKKNKEMEKYLMTFQNLIVRIPNWNPNIIEEEKKRIIKKSNCNYLEDLIVCVHIIQLKLLTAIRVSSKQKKIDINIPKLDDFIHKIYINVARKLYKNVYLFELNVPPLQIQKNNRELELIIKECILNSVRESIPIEEILRAYMDETYEEELIEEIKEEKLNNNILNKENSSSEEEGEIIEELNEEKLNKNDNNIDNDNNNDNINKNIENKKQEIKFNNIDSVYYENSRELINAPKDVETLEKSYKGEMNLDNDELDKEDFKINITNENISLDNLQIENLNNDIIKINKNSNNNENENENFILDDIEILT